MNKVTKQPDHQNEKELEREQEAIRLLRDFVASVREEFSDRDLRLIANCITYSGDDPAGLPAHNIALIVAKLAAWQGIDRTLIDYMLNRGKTALEVVREMERDDWELIPAD